MCLAFGRPVPEKFMDEIAQLAVRTLGSFSALLTCLCAGATILNRVASHSPTINEEFGPVTKFSARVEAVTRMPDLEWHLQ